MSMTSLGTILISTRWTRESSFHRSMVRWANCRQLVKLVLYTAIGLLASSVELHN